MVCGCVAQDASTASLVWTLTLMAEYPDVLEKVRIGSVCTHVCCVRPCARTQCRAVYVKHVRSTKASIRPWMGKMYVKGVWMSITCAASAFMQSPASEKYLHHEWG